MSDGSTPTPLTPLSALERQMGIASVSGGSPFDGAIESDPDATPPPGRAPVSYGDDDALFAATPPGGSDVLEDAQMAADANQEEEDEEEDADGDAGEGIDIGSMMAALGPGGDAGALIGQLEAMAQAFEAASGEPETEIRGKIAMLKGVIDASGARWWRAFQQRKS